jgi:hypothetical protein
MTCLIKRYQKQSHPISANSYVSDIPSRSLNLRALCTDAMLASDYDDGFPYAIARLDRIRIQASIFPPSEIDNLAR